VTEAVRLFSKAIEFHVFLVKRFQEDHCLLKAASLSYTTLLSLVPLLAVGFSVISAFPVFGSVVSRMQDYIFRTFLPASSEVIQTYVQQFIHQTAQLTGPGIVFLVLLALMLMDSIEGVLNGIWRVRTSRQWLARFLVYWAVLTLGPLLLAVSIAVTSYLVPLSLLTDTDAVFPAGLNSSLLSLMPFVATTVALTLVYVLVPNCNVSFRHGLVGGAVAALLFELAKRSFTVYVANVPTYSTIYGALAVIPLFLVWIYVSWVVVLLGAELSYCLTLFHNRVGLEEHKKYASNFICAYRIIGHLWAQQRCGGTLTLAQLIRLEPGISEERLDVILDQLEKHQLIRGIAGAEWMLARDPGEIRLLDIYHALPRALPDCLEDWGRLDHWNQALYKVINKAENTVLAALDVPVKQLFQTAEQEADGGGGSPVNGANERLQDEKN